MKIDNQMEHVAEALRRLGILRTYRGHQAIMAAVQLALEDESRLHQVTKGIYMEAAHHCNQSWSAVERNIRTAARRAWEANPRYLELLAGYPLNGPPSAGELIEILATDAMRQFQFHSPFGETSGSV